MVGRGFSMFMSKVRNGWQVDLVNRRYGIMAQHNCNIVDGVIKPQLRLIMPPTLKKVMGHIGFRLCICPSVCASISQSRTVHVRVLKFHIWIPHGKIAHTCLFSCPCYLPFWSYAPLKNSEWNLMYAISYELCMLGFWNFINGFLMEK